MNHIDKHLTAWLGGELDRTVREQIRTHCEVCVDCRRLLARSEAAWQLLGELPAPSPARPAWEGIALALHRQRPGSPAWLRWSYPAAAAAALVCGVLLGDRIAGESDGVARILANDIIAGTLLSESAAADLDDLLATAWNEPVQGRTR